jgi:hypothetical protein
LLKINKAELTIARAELPEFQVWLPIYYSRKKAAKNGGVPEKLQKIYLAAAKVLVEKTRTLPYYKPYKEAKADYLEAILIYEYSWEEEGVVEG